MAIWAIADLHLSFGTPDKSMDVFGENWKEHAQKIEKNWREVVADDDLVLVPGDISWAMRLDDALVDLQWIDRLPGQKVMLRGNHDYWWGSMGKMAKIMPPSIQLIHNTAFHWQGVGIAGTRLWDSWEYQFNSYIDFVDRADRKVVEAKKPPSQEETEKIFVRELQRLEMSLNCLEPKADKRIVMTHYPPISADLQPSRVSALLEKYEVDICVFGHLHNVRRGETLFGTRGTTSYILVSADYLDFKLMRIS